VLRLNVASFWRVALIKIIDQDQPMSLPHLEHRARNASSRITLERWRRHPFVTRLERCIVLSDDDLGSLLRLIEAEVVVEKRRDVVVDGYEYRKLCFVGNGSSAARYKLLRNGKRQIVNLVLPGDVVGLPSSFLERAHYSVIAIADLKLQVSSINAYVDLCYERPQFALALSWLAMQEAGSCAEHAISTGRRTPVERLAHFLLEIYWRLALVGLASKSRFDLPFSQEVMSDALGLRFLILIARLQNCVWTASSISMAVTWNLPTSNPSNYWATFSRSI
jgi:CRP-like cAMP-binding protein